MNIPGHSTDLRIVDTDVVSYILRRDPRADAFSDLLQTTEAALSFQTVAELLQGALYSNWGDRRLSRLRQEMNKYSAIPYEASMAEHFARARATRRRLGRPLEVGDAWIAATALSLGCPVVTNNLADFSDIPGLAVLSAGAR